MPYNYKNLDSHSKAKDSKKKIVSSSYPKSQKTGKVSNPALPPVKE